MTIKTLLLGEYWDINTNLSYGVPGYLFVRNLSGLNDQFEDINPKEYEELGKMLGLAASAVEHCTQVERVFTGKFGLVPNWALHFHVVPIYDWVLKEFSQKTDMQTLRESYPADYPTIPDGADILKFMWHEYCFTGNCPVDFNPDEIVTKIGDYLNANKQMYNLDYAILTENTE